MSAYTFPRSSFNALVESLGKDHAEKVVSSFEQIINDQRNELQQKLEDTRKDQKTQIKDELRSELITKELFEERFKTVDERFKTIEAKIQQLDSKFDERFKRLDLKLNIFIGIALVSLTFANPTFVELIKHIIK